MAKAKKKKPMAVPMSREELYRRKVEKLFQGPADYNKSVKKR